MRVTRTGLLAGAAGLIGATAAALYVRELGTEHAGYTVEQDEGAFAVRRYPQLLVAETRAAGGRKQALNTGFGRLAGYIFGTDRPDGDRSRIAMTAPVLADRTGACWRTRFVLPRGLTAGELPDPGAEVAIAQAPARRVAAVRFAGRATDTRLEDAERTLRAWLLTRGLTPTGPVEYAFYNSPMTPGPLRRNEVLLPLDG